MAPSNILQYFRLGCYKCLDPLQRKEFFFQLAEQLSTKYRAARQNNSSEHEDPKRSTATSSNATHSNKRKICQVRLRHNNKTNNICEKC